MMQVLKNKRIAFYIVLILVILLGCLLSLYYSYSHKLSNAKEFLKSYYTIEGYHTGPVEPDDITGLQEQFSPYLTAQTLDKLTANRLNYAFSSAAEERGYTLSVAKVTINKEKNNAYSFKVHVHATPSNSNKSKEHVVIIQTGRFGINKDNLVSFFSPDNILYKKLTELPKAS